MGGMTWGVGSSLNAVATDSYTTEEKAQIVDSCFQAHGFFPDVREENELPADIRKMRQFKSGNELKDIKAKYDALSDDSERCYNILVDLGLMEDYSKWENTKRMSNRLY